MADYWHNTLLIWKLTKRWEREEHVVCQTSSTVMIYSRETSCFSSSTTFLWFGNKQTLNSPHLSSLKPVNKPVYMTDRGPGELLQSTEDAGTTLHRDHETRLDLACSQWPDLINEAARHLSDIKHRLSVCESSWCVQMFLHINKLMIVTTDLVSPWWKLSTFIQVLNLWDTFITHYIYWISFVTL